MPGTDAALALGAHARADRARPRRPRLRRALHGRLRRARRARGRVDAGARGRDLPHHGRAGRARSRATTARSSPRRSALNYGMQRVAGGGNAVRAIACLPALIGAWRDPRRRRAALVVGHVPGRQRGARAAGPHPRHAAHDQHVDDRRRAARRARSADPRDLRLQHQSGRRRAGLGARCARASRARTCSSSCTRSVPDRHRRLRRHPAARDHAARARRRAQLVRPPATCWPTTRRSSRSARRCPTPRCSAGWRRAWASTSRASATPTTTSRARRSARDDPRMRAISTGTRVKRMASGASNVPERLRAVRAGRLPDAVGQVRVRRAHRLRRTATTRCPR